MPNEIASPQRRHPSAWLARVVGAEVHEGEWRLVALFFANLFLLLTAYYILKIIREPLILVSGSAAQRSYARALEAGVLVFLIPLYSAVANRVEPARLVKWISAAFVVALVGFYAGRRTGLNVGFAFFVWLGIFSTVSIAQFWSFANDVMTEAQGRRLFPLVAVGGTAGGVLGAQFAARAISHLSPEAMMLVAAGLVVVCIALTHVTQASTLARRQGGTEPARAPRDLSGGFTLVARDRYLLLVALSVIAVNLITGTGDFLLAHMVSTKAHALPAAARARYLGAFYGDLQTWVTILTAFAQIFVVSRVFRRAGIGNALLFMPVLVLGGYATVALVPLLAAMTVVKLGESTADYSLANTIQHALFLPTSRDAKYKAKSAIDTLGKRLGDLGAAGLVFLGSRASFGVRDFAVANVATAVLWLWLSFQLRRRREEATVAKVAAGMTAPSAAVA
jgi:ATP:ADP antiporter, AAA family